MLTMRFYTTLYMHRRKFCIMKNVQLLSVVFSLIMLTGVSAGSVAFAGDVDSEMKEKLEKYCEMSDEEKKDYLAENNKTEDHAKKMEKYCTLGESEKADFIAEHRDEYKAHMKEKYGDKMHDKKKHHMDYDKLCEMDESDRAAEINNTAKLDKINNWCAMTPAEREEYKKKHHADMKDKMTDKMSDKMSGMKDAMSNMTDKMSDKMTDKMTDMKDMMSDKSKRLQAIIMAKYDISDEQLAEIKMKYQEKYGDMSDEQKSELKMKFMSHMESMKSQISDERKAEIHDRVSAMRDFKAKLREGASDMTDEEKQQLREEFIEKAKDLQLAWITPRIQIAAGIDASEVECREGLVLALKSSNGAPLCLTADTALKMIERELVVPAN